jgi:hypothetical protein
MGDKRLTYLSQWVLVARDQPEAAVPHGVNASYWPLWASQRQSRLVGCNRQPRADRGRMVSSRKGLRLSW